jgi:hypothetical protein
MVAFSRSVAGCALLLSMGACETDAPGSLLPDAEFTFETTHLRVAPVDDALLCAGTLAQWEAHTTYLLDVFDLELQQPIPIYLFARSAGRYCPETLGGCYQQQTIFGTKQVAQHEIVHAVLALTGSPPSTLPPSSVMTESSAVAFEGDLPILYTGRKISPGFLFSDDLYSFSHFMRWVAEHHSYRTFLDFYAITPNEEGSFNAALVDVFGVSESEIIKEYLATAAYAYPGQSLCQSEPVPWIGSDDLESLEHNFALNCDNTDTFGPDYSTMMSARITVEIAEDGWYLFGANSVDGEIVARRCVGADELDPQPFANITLAEDVPLTVDTPTLLRAGRYEIVVRVPLSTRTVPVKLLGYRTPVSFD